MLAGGVAAAVVAIVAISVGNRGSTPAAADPHSAAKVAMVQSTGPDGRTTVMTVTAPVSTVNGVVVALVADADGNLRSLPVVTATPPATPEPTGSSSGAPPRSTANRTPDSTGSANAAGNAAGTGNVTVGSTPRVAVDGTSTSTTERPTPTTSVSPAPVQSEAVPAPGDVATVVTGLTTLTGWVPITTP